MSKSLARIGALVLGVVWALPVVVALAASQVRDGENSLVEGAWLIAWTSALVWSIATVATVLLTSDTLKSSRVLLGAFAAARATSAWVSLGVLYDDAKQTAVVSLALSIPMVVFPVLLLVTVARLYDERSARAIRGVAAGYAVYRCVVLALWALPPEAMHFLTSFHHWTAPIVELVVALVLLGTARRISAVDARVG